MSQAVPRRSLFARLRERLHRRAAPAAGARKSPQPVAAAPPAKAPPPHPLTIRQWLYGPGYIIPGNEDYVIELVRPFNLGPAATLLDMAAGLGGPARSISAKFNNYIAGYERDPDLVRRALAESVARGFGKRIQISAYDPENFELRPSFYDSALAREATYQLAQKERFLGVLNQALKPLGQLVVTDFVLDAAHGDRPELAAWAAGLRLKPQLWTEAQYTECIAKLGYDLRIASDVTAEYRRMILNAWKALLEGGGLRQARAARTSTLIDELEATVRVNAALESGALKFYYFVALGGRKPVS